MQFHMQELMARGLKSTVRKELDVSDLFKGRADVVSTGPLHVSLEVAGHEGFVTVDGELSIDLELACSRCLEPTQEHTVIPYFEQFKPASDAKEEEDGNEGEDDDFVEVKADKLDLLPYLEEALLVFMPFAPLCGKDCKGLCQTCGENLNERACECKHERIDPRFASLKDLFKE
ncbi:YceD family protein [Paenibacillus sp. GCM10027627]|uniref:YceD family protein n=1 Tax=unclassified Paenibacillus TaxID=185978 RepID=UPI0036305239